MHLILPITRALGQLGDPVFVGVLWRSVVLSVLCFIGLDIGTSWLVHQYIDAHGSLGWLADVAGAVGAGLVALWLFLPVAAGIGMLYLERIARAVEWRHYPWLPPPAGEALTMQVWDGIVVALQVLSWNVAALVLAFLLPWVGWALGWLIAAYAVGRGLFVAVAMRRMPRRVAESVYYANRLSVLGIGGVLAVAAYVPLMNLLLPLIGTAAMVHLLDLTMTAGARNAPFRGGLGS